jgi:repressor of nif and glnA expression
MTTPQIEMREPPPRTVSGRRPLMALDQDILSIAAEPLRPVQIADVLRRQGQEITTQRVASRLKSLVSRDLAVRVRPVGGPANGPGTSLYRAKKDEDGKGAQNGG